MVQSLSEYVKQLQLNGYSFQAIRAHLARSGYSFEEIDSAFSGRSKKVWSKLLITGGAVVVVGVIITVFIVLYASSMVLLEVKAPGSVVFAPGETIIFGKTLSSSDKMSVVITYELVFNNEVVAQKSEKLLISGVSVTQSRLRIPLTVMQGKYWVKVRAVFDGRSVSDEFSVIIKSEGISENVSVQPSVSPAIENVCPGACVVSNPCLRGLCVEGVCQFEQVLPCCGDGKCELGESCSEDCGAKKESREQVIASAQFVVSSDVSKAILLCNSLIEDTPVDACLSTIAQVAQKSSLCNSVRSEDVRDSCFMDFALRDDFSVCDKIVNRYLVNSCVYLKNAQST